MQTELEKLRIDRSSTLSTKPGRKRNPWLAVALAGGGPISLALLAYSRFSTPIEVTVYRIPAHAQTEVRNGQATILSAAGYIIAAHKIEVAPKVPGKVAWVGVEKGNKVKQGQELVRLEDSEYRPQVLQAQGNVENLKARLLELERGSRPQEIAKAKADFESAKADMVNSEVTLNRTRTLVNDGVLARQNLDDAQGRYDAQSAKASSLEQSYELEKLGPREEEIASMRAQFDQAKGALDYAMAQLDGTIIRAPVTGTILERNVERGEFVTTGFVGDKGAKGYVVSLADLSDLQVELDIDQTNFAKLKPTQSAVITTDAFPDRKYIGHIVEVSPEADRQKATIQVKVKIENADEYLRPDMNASVAFREESNATDDAKTAQNGILVPVAAMRNNTVFVVDNNHVRQCLVALGNARDGSAEVTEGLAAGEEIVLDPPVSLKNGDRIRVKGRP